VSKDFTHTIPVETGRTAYPLIATVTATFDNDGSIDRWALAVQGNQLSVKNRDSLKRMIRIGVMREGVSGDGIGAKWETPNRLAIWTSQYNWSLTTTQARAFSDEIDVAIGRFAEEAKPAPAPFPWEVSTPAAANPAARIAELETENAKLREMVAFLRQYAPR
jgi:hypothetical protein